MNYRDRAAIALAKLHYKKQRAARWLREFNWLELLGGLAAVLLVAVLAELFKLPKAIIVVAAIVTIAHYKGSKAVKIASILLLLTAIAGYVYYTYVPKPDAVTGTQLENEKAQQELHNEFLKLLEEKNKKK